MASPRRIVPGRTTLALRPRRRSCLPTPTLTKRSASLPKRAANLAQPVCGCSVISMTASPIASRVPAGRLSWLMSKSTWSWSPARARTSSSSPPTSRDSRALMTLSCMSGCELPSSVRPLPRTIHVSPTTPSVVDSSASSRISRPSISGRRTIRSSVPPSRGELRISSSPASSDAVSRWTGATAGTTTSLIVRVCQRSAAADGPIARLWPVSPVQRSACSAHRSIGVNPSTVWA